MSLEAGMFSAGGIVAAHDTPAFYPEVERLPLPHDFQWGTATAAYQIEGGASQDGKGPSIWDTFSHLSPSRTNGENADIACDHYNRTTADIKLMASLGVDVYRFSIAWSRIIPLGGRNDPINEQGIAFYNNLIDELLAHNIAPVVTLYHWDAPEAIYDRYGAFLNTEEFQADFENYAHLCFSRFGDRVRKWVTFNEPYIISIFAYLNGTLAPGHCRAVGTDTKTEPWIVGHTIILCHATVVLGYANEFRESQNGEISIVLNGHYYEPYDQASSQDRDAAECRLLFYIAWFGDPIFLGKDYPAAMRTYLGARLPTFTAKQLELLRRAAPVNTYYGMNHYSTKYVRALSDPPADDDWTGNTEELSINSEGKEIGPVSGVSWLRVAPEGFRKLLNWIWNRYRLAIIVTENGCPCPGEDDVSTAIDDKFRQWYFGLYLDAISRAIYEDGITIDGYYVWSLMDNYGMFSES
ncbi:Glycoside hydrolase family 1 [Penicillium manginii]|jgi:beta-glucosidase|uniref:Glycoside hydrolase family 1 n=1 Tax=Penicillium manginii TaxID=203109 RepID=UPI0025471B0B|nr:Glycoside hydrolase family 1 [Penicillium manginii]KAJ5761585.1 Glycoside hydrolase family 1 [Penicillium manginii]